MLTKKNADYCGAFSLRPVEKPVDSVENSCGKLVIICYTLKLCKRSSGIGICGARPELTVGNCSVSLREGLLIRAIVFIQFLNYPAPDSLIVNCP